MRMCLSEIYGYVFEGRAKINVENVPSSLREKRINEIKEAIKKKFDFVTSSKTLSTPFRNMLAQIGSRDLEKILYGSNQEPKEEKNIHDEYLFPSDNEIKNKFQQLDDQYGHFQKEKTVNTQFISLFKACKLVADYVECNNANKNEVAYLHAYKLLALLEGNMKKIDDYINQFMSDSKKPVHDLLIFPLPKIEKDKSIDINSWRKLIKKTPVAIRYFQQAIAIEAILNKAPKDIQEAQKASSQVTYIRAKENPELAELCIKYQHTEDDFNRCLSVTPKKSDNLPTQCIDGNKLNCPGYYFVKLPIDDPHAFVLGDITNCCQSIGGDSEQCVIDAIQLKNNALYVLLKAKILKEEKSTSTFPPIVNNKIDYQHYDIVGQGYVYYSDTGNIVIDSWENRTPSVDDKVIAIMLPVFAKNIVEEKGSNVLRVTIGLGGKTPDIYDEAKVALADVILEGHQYPDSFRQGLIYVSRDKEEKLRKSLEEKMHFSDDLPIEAIQRLAIIATDEKHLQILKDIYFSSVNIEDQVFNIGSLYILAKNGILTEDDSYIQFLTGCGKRDAGSYLYHSLLMLHFANLLNKTISSIFKEFFHENYSYYNAMAMAVLLEWLYKINCLNNDNLTLLIKNMNDLKGIYEAILILEKAGITPDEAYFKLFCSSPKKSWCYARALEILKTADLLTDDNHQFIAQFYNKEDVRAMAKAMAVLAKEKLLDENRNLLSDYMKQHDDGELYYKLDDLDEYEMLTSKNILCILKNPDNAASRTDILICLNIAGILTDQNIALLVQCTKNIDTLEELVLSTATREYGYTGHILKCSVTNLEAIITSANSMVSSTSSSSASSSSMGLFSSSTSSAIVSETTTIVKKQTPESKR